MKTGDCIVSQKYMKPHNIKSARKKIKRNTSRKHLRQKGGVRFRPTSKQELQTAIQSYMHQENHNYRHIRTWDVTLVSDFSHLFFNFNNMENNLFDGIQDWNVSNVTNMERMFYNCRLFNQPLNAWNVSQVTNMSRMFENCTTFNQPLHNWNVSQVETMTMMFFNCGMFNQSLNDWNVLQVTSMSHMFEQCEIFNSPLHAWNVSNVRSMAVMFARCRTFNQPLNDWNVSNVTDMGSMFSDCTSFNQPLTNWNIRVEARFGYIFYNCPISEENKPARIREREHAPPALYQPLLDEFDDDDELDDALPMPGIAFQVHNEFNSINKQELLSLLPNVATHDFSTINNPNFVNYVKHRLQEAITSVFTAEERQPLLTALDALYTNLQMTDFSQQLTPEYRNLFGKSLDFMLEQPADVVKEYLRAYVEECAVAYGTNLDITQMNPTNMSCVKGRFERLVMCVKTALFVQCVENPNAPACLPIYRKILKRVFHVNISEDGTTTEVVELDKNELIQQWNSEHLENEEYKTANGVGEMSEDQRRNFFRNDFIQFMRSAYDRNHLLTAAIQSMIEQETDQLDLAGVFRNMMFGGRGRGRSRRRKGRGKSRKIYKRRQSKNKSRKRNLCQKYRRLRTQHKTQ